VGPGGSLKQTALKIYTNLWKGKNLVHEWGGHGWPLGQRWGWLLSLGQSVNNLYVFAVEKVLGNRMFNVKYNIKSYMF
jgi:hypothetical protein